MAVDVVQEIKLRTDLVELISGYVPLKRSGRTHKGLCPFHGEKTPSFHVDGERGFFKCYGCGVGGDCFSFLQQKEGLSFQEAGEMLARKLGLEWVRRGDTVEARSQRERLYDITAMGERYFRQCLAQSREVQAYLERRGLLPETIEQFRLGYAPADYEGLLRWLKQQKASIDDALAADLLLEGEHGLRDRFVDRLMFPIFDLEGRPIAFGGRTLRPDGIPKYLNSRETPIFQKGKTLYGLHLAKKAIPEAGFAVAVEGYMDLIAVHQAGIANAVAGLGTAITDTHVGVLRRYKDELVFCYDGDGAGIRAALKNSAMFEAAGCNVRVASLPEGEDPDTFIKKEGADAFRSLLNRAMPLLDYQLEVLRAKYDLRNSDNRLPFVREAAREIARSGSHLTRQEYAAKLVRMLERLAEEWYPGDPRQAMQARVALTQEVERLLQSDRINRRPGAMAPAAPAPAGSTSVRERAERYVLRAALSEARWADLVAERVAAADFQEPALAGLAGTLFGHNPSGEAWAANDVAGRAEQIREDPASAGTVSALLLDESPLTEEGLVHSLDLLERARKEARRNELMRLYASGEIASSDPAAEEYRALLSELSGRQRRED